MLAIIQPAQRLLAMGIALAWLAACSASTTAAAAHGDEYLLVAAGSSLAAHPGPNPLRGRDGRTEARERPQGAYHVFRYVAEAGPWLEVESVAPPREAGHCYTGVPGLEGLRLRLFVSRLDVVPVLTRALSVSYDDDTWVSFRPGVALGAALAGMADHQADRHEVAVDGLVFAVTVPGDAIGTRYLPAAAAARAPVAGQLQGDLYYGHSRKVHLGNATDAPVVADAFFTRTGQLRVHARTTCTDLGGVAAPAAYGPLPAASAPRVESGIIPCWRVGARARAWWPDGTPVGASTQYVNLGVEGRADDTMSGRRCFDVPLRPDRPTGQALPGDETLPLCFAPADLTRVSCPAQPGR